MTRSGLAVVSAGLSRPSSTRLLGEQLAAATRRALLEQGKDVEIVHLELRDLAHDVVNNLLTGFPSPDLAAAIERVTSADGLIVVTPIFSASYSGLFKSFFDILEPAALTGKPVLVAATGGSARHSLALEYALRPLFAYLRADVAATAVFAATADWGSAAGSGTGAAESDLAERVQRAGRDLAGLIDRSARSRPGRAADPFGQPSSFLQLLGNSREAGRLRETLRGLG